MGKGSSTTVAAPDPVATANAQAAANSKAAQESAKMSAVDMYGPDGSVVYQRDANGVPISQTTSLTGTNQQTHDTQNQIGLTLAQKAQETLGNLPTDQYSMATSAPYDPRSVDTGAMSIWSKGASDFAYDPSAYGDVSQIDQNAANAVFQSGAAQLSPVFQQQTDRQAQNMHDRGLPIDGKAVQTADANLQRNQNNAWNSLAQDSYMAGHQVAGDNIDREQGLRSTAINEALTFSNQANSDWSQKLNTEQQLRGQIQNEDIQDRNRAFNEASLYMQGSPAYGSPDAVSTPTYNVAAPDVQGAYALNYQAQKDNAAAKAASGSSIWNGIGTAAGAATSLWMMSSKELKNELGDAESFLRAADRAATSRLSL